MDDTTLTIIFSFVTGLITLVCAQGVTALIAYRKDKRAEKAEIEQRTTSSHEVLIQDLRARLDSVIIDLKTLQTEHLDCVKNQEHLRGENLALLKQIETLDKEVQTLREWRHALANTLHAETLRQAVANLPHIDMKVEELIPPSTEHT